MEELINILDQQFYYSHVDALVDGCARFDKCAIIIDEADLLMFLKKGMHLVEEKINHMIVIGENLDKVFVVLKNKNVFLLAASDFKEAIRFAIMNAEVSKNIVCVSRESEVSKLIQAVII